jgi:cytochrome c oxidase subunit 3
VPKHHLGEQYADFAHEDETLELGMWVFLASELLLFAALFALYAAYRVLYRADFEAALHHNTIVYGTVNLFVLLTSSFTVALAVWSARRGRARQSLWLLVATMVLGLVFLGVKLAEYAKHIDEGALPGRYFHWHEQPTFGANRFFTMYWAMTGLHALHVTAGLGVLGWLTFRTARGFYTAEHHVGLEMGALYWHLVDVIWIFLWPLMYLS